MGTVELRHLTTFTAVVEDGTFGRAASRLGYTQSSVSQQIAALERALGGQVFDRRGGPRGVQLTALGTLVRQHAARVLEASADLDRAVHRFRAGATRLDIGTLQSVSTVVLPTLLTRLGEEYPDCEVHLVEGEAEVPRIAHLDLLFTDGPIDDDVRSAKLLDDPYVLVARPGDHPSGVVPVAALDKRAMVAWPIACDQPRLEQALRAGGARPRIVFRSANNEALLAMVRAGLGIAVLPRLAVTEAAADDRLSLHPLEPTPAREIYLHWPRRRSLTAVAQRAITLAREQARQLAQPAPT